MSEAKNRTVLVIGASGIIGSAHVRRLAGRAGVNVIAVSRQPPAASHDNVTSLALDLNKPPDEAARALKPVTHAVFAGFAGGVGGLGQYAENVALFEAAAGLMARHCPLLEHICLIEGMKAYGSHLGPFKTPARESDPRIAEGHFYYDQEDCLAERSCRHGWQWTALRPHVVIGPARRSPQNLAAVIGVYASLMKQAGPVLDFPGPAAAFDVVYQATDAGLLSRAIDWAGETPAAAGEVFNITNGDFFRWRYLWPRIAKLFGMEAGGPADRSLARDMAGKSGQWQALVQDHGLEDNALDALVSWPFADYIFGTTWDVMAHTGKCRDAGFLHFADSEQSILDRLQELRDLKIIP